MSAPSEGLPLAGLKVVELGHVVMGTCCSLILADMGAEVIKIERMPDGDVTRGYGGFGAGLYHYFNRNKTSLPLNLKTDEGRDVLRRAISVSDVFIENFAPGAVERLGFSYDECRGINPRLVYCSLKGFMPGPHENRPSLDNLVQMMGGLAYMTGPTGQPLRAGASVTDILGGTFGALGILAALRQRETTGEGSLVIASLFEAVAFMVAQHMSGAAVTGLTPPPMPESENPWAVYDLFATSDGKQVCIGIISDRHWTGFCNAFGLTPLLEGTASNAERLASKPRLLAAIRERIGALTLAEVEELGERSGVPFAPVRRPDELFDDVHLNQSGGLLDTRLPDGRVARLPKLPMRMSGHDFDLRRNPPKLGEGGNAFLAGLGYDAAAIENLRRQGVVLADD